MCRILEHHKKNINTVLNAILLTFIICQFPLLVNSILRIIYSDSLTSSECDSIHLYFSGVVFVLVALNSAVKPFIYIVLNNHFTWHIHSLNLHFRSPLFAAVLLLPGPIEIEEVDPVFQLGGLRNEGAETIEMSRM